MSGTKLDVQTWKCASPSCDEDCDYSQDSGCETERQCKSVGEGNYEVGLDGGHNSRRLFVD